MLDPMMTLISYSMLGSSGASSIDTAWLVFCVASGICAVAVLVLNLPGVPLAWGFRLFVPLLGVAAIGLYYLQRWNDLPLLIAGILGALFYAGLWWWTMSERRMLETMGPVVPRPVWTANY